MLDANLILTIRLYSLIVTVNMVGFCVCVCVFFFFHFPILLNKLVLCGLSIIIMYFCLVPYPFRGWEAWLLENKGTKGQEVRGLGASGC